MHCSSCGKCCETTEMELSSDGIKESEKVSYTREKFTDMDCGGIRLRNVDGRCYFYNLADKKCRVYEKRPSGCYLYPVAYLVDESAAGDKLCPRMHTISEKELGKKEESLANY